MQVGSMSPVRPWFILSAVSLLLALAHERLISWSLLFVADTSLPELLALLRNTRQVPFLVPLLILFVGWRAKQDRALNSQSAILAGSAVVFGFHLTLGYALVWVWVSFADGLLPKRLPAGIRDIIAQCDQATLISISTQSGLTVNPRAEAFQAYPVLGKLLLDKPASHEIVITNLLADIDASGAGRSLCFNPRHGLSVRRGGEQVDLLICYECRNLQVIRSPHKWWIHGIDRHSKDEINKLLKEAGVPLAPESSK